MTLKGVQICAATLKRTKKLEEALESAEKHVRARKSALRREVARGSMWWRVIASSGTRQYAVTHVCAYLYATALGDI